MRVVADYFVPGGAGLGCVQEQQAAGRAPTFSELVQDVKDGKVEKITLNSVTGDVHGKYKNGDEFHSTVPPTYNDFTTLLIDKGVAVNVEKDNGGNWVSILVNAIPFVLLLGFWIFMMRQMQSGGNKALSFGKSRARGCIPRSRRRSRSRTSRASRKPRKSCRRSSSSCASRRNSRSWADAFPRACC